MKIQKLIKIIKAKLQKTKPHTEDWQIEREKICDVCPYNSSNAGAKNMMYDIINRKNEYCMECGCELHLKQQFELESCPIGKWKEHVE